jgi:hypothetical protein
LNRKWPLSLKRHSNATFISLALSCNAGKCLTKKVDKLSCRFAIELDRLAYLVDDLTIVRSERIKLKKSFPRVTIDE